jgi:hypothetical protein
MRTLHVTAAGQPKGEITKEHGRFIWLRNSGAKEPFAKRFSLHDVAYHIAALCRVPPEEVRFVDPEEVARLGARTCEHCGKPKGCFSYRVVENNKWRRGYFHKRCFDVVKHQLAQEK